MALLGQLRLSDDRVAMALLNRAISLLPHDHAHDSCNWLHWSQIRVTADLSAPLESSFDSIVVHYDVSPFVTGLALRATCSASALLDGFAWLLLLAVQHTSG